MVVAHPDDDAYGVAAVVALHLTDPGFRFFLVHATDGEGGAIAEGSGATLETLGAVRRVEDANAWRVVGRSPYRRLGCRLRAARLLEVAVPGCCGHDRLTLDNEPGATETVASVHKVLGASTVRSPRSEVHGKATPAGTPQSWPLR